MINHYQGQLVHILEGKLFTCAAAEGEDTRADCDMRDMLIRSDVDDDNDAEKEQEVIEEALEDDDDKDGSSRTTTIMMDTNSNFGLSRPLLLPKSNRN